MQIDRSGVQSLMTALLVINQDREDSKREALIKMTQPEA